MEVPFSAASGLLGAALLAVMFLNYCIYRHFVRKQDSYCLAATVVVCTLSASLLAVILVPIDIYILSEGSVSAASMRLTQASLRKLYFSLFGLLLFLAFGGIPFAFFYGDEIDKGTTDDFDEDMEPCGRSCRALRRTFVFIFAVAALLLAGLFFKPGVNIQPKLSWVKELLDLNHAGYGSVMFSIACLTLVGNIGWMSYTAYGMASLPFVWLRGRPSSGQLRLELEADIAEVRSKQRALQMKYGGRAFTNATNTKMTTEDRRELKRLEQQQSKLSHHNYRLQEEEQMLSSRFIGYALKMLVPFRLLVGTVFQLASLVVVYAVIVTCLDRVLHSSCGYSCGFILSHGAETEVMWMWNPLDSFLLYMSQYFPLDFVCLSLLVLYIFVASIYGILNLGSLRAMRWTAASQNCLYCIMPHKSMPQALLVLCFILIHILLALSMVLVTLSPRYATYGTQSYLPENGSGKLSCYLAATTQGGGSQPGAGASVCRMSVVATVFSGISHGIPVLSFAYFCTSLAFVVVFVCSSIYCGMFQKPKFILHQQQDEDEAESDAEESRRLVRVAKGV
eukprot:GHVQ01019772.1.p1 GENE.GHVQ01019772.1~~GHVQ01019772.1.p1  ORF type:complete len:564 (+),score=48.87 GHVQ01019772.1:816-2507(+)